MSPIPLLVMRDASVVGNYSVTQPVWFEAPSRPRCFEAPSPRQSPRDGWLSPSNKDFAQLTNWEVPLDVNANAMKEGIFTIGGHKINSALDAHILLEADAKKHAQPWQPGGPTADRRSSAAAALLRCTASNNFGHACTVWCFHVSVEVCASHLAVQPILIVDRSATPVVVPQGRLHKTTPTCIRLPM